MYTAYLGYRFRYNPNIGRIYVINSLGEVGVVVKHKDTLRVNFHDRKDIIKPDVIINGLIRRHGKNFPVILSRMFKM